MAALFYAQNIYYYVYKVIVIYIVICYNYSDSLRKDFTYGRKKR